MTLRVRILTLWDPFFFSQMGPRALIRVSQTPRERGVRTENRDLWNGTYMLWACICKVKIYLKQDVL